MGNNTKGTDVHATELVLRSDEGPEFVMERRSSCVYLRVETDAGNAIATFLSAREADRMGEALTDFAKQLRKMNGRAKATTKNETA